MSMTSIKSMFSTRVFRACVPLALALALCACDVEDAVNDLGEREQDFEEELEDVRIKKTGGLCTPAAVSFDEIIGDEVDWWDDAKGRLKDVTVHALNFAVPKNENTENVSVDLYLSTTTNVDAVTADEFLGTTGEILPGFIINDWVPMDLAPDGKKRMEKLVLESDTEFTVCAKIPEVEAGTVPVEALDMRMELQIVATAVFVPIGD
ncbi:hypothetical protein K8I61_05380 [bacterium]|nr:hypothetical protein [bacterium]